MGQLYDAALHQKRRERAEQALAILQHKGFPELVSLQQLEHRDLERALHILPRRFKPVLSHLVTENRRVQKLVVAARRRDWQLFGAMLLMSHASLRDDWGQTKEEVDLVVEQVEAMSLEGMYGACVTGRGGCVLVLGKPFVVPACLDRIEAVFQNRFGRKPEMMVL
jgi:galactokinase